MFLGGDFLASYWWAIPLALLAVVATFVLVAGRSAEGDAGARARAGWSKWRALSRKAAELQVRVILTVFYFTVGGVFGLPRTYLADPLRARTAARDRAWLPRAPADPSLEAARRQG